MIEGIPLVDMAPPTLLGIFFLLVMFGRLVPWWFYKAKAEEAEKWRLAFETERKSRVASDAQTAELLELAKTTHSIIAAVLTPPQHSASGGAYVVPTQKK